MKNSRIIFLIIPLILLTISGCLQLVPSIRKAQRELRKQKVLEAFSKSRVSTKPGLIVVTVTPRRDKRLRSASR